jgi:hypothetical protein
MRFPRFLAGGLLLALTFGAGAAHAGVLIKVDKATQRMSVWVGGEVRHSWPVSTGMAGYSTPAGFHAPSHLSRHHRSREWDDAPMPHAIFFTSRGHAIHGSQAVHRLGSPASHGCVRLSPENAATLFALVKEEGVRHTRISITGQDAAAVAGKPAGPRVAARAQPPGARPVQAGRAWWPQDAAPGAGSVAGGPFDRYYAPRQRYEPRGGYGGW